MSLFLENRFQSIGVQQLVGPLLQLGWGSFLEFGFDPGGRFPETSPQLSAQRQGDTLLHALFVPAFHTDTFGAADVPHFRTRLQVMNLIEKSVFQGLGQGQQPVDKLVQVQHFWLGPAPLVQPPGQGQLAGQPLLWVLPGRPRQQMGRRRQGKGIGIHLQFRQPPLIV